MGYAFVFAKSVVSWVRLSSASGNGAKFDVGAVKQHAQQCGGSSTTYSTLDHAETGIAEAGISTDWWSIEQIIMAQEAEATCSSAAVTTRPVDAQRLPNWRLAHAISRKHQALRVHNWGRAGHKQAIDVVRSSDIRSTFASAG